MLLGLSRVLRKLYLNKSYLSNNCFAYLTWSRFSLLVLNFSGLGGCKETQTHKHLFHKRTLIHLAKLAFFPAQSSKGTIFWFAFLQINFIWISKLEVFVCLADFTRYLFWVLLRLRLFYRHGIYGIYFPSACTLHSSTIWFSWNNLCIIKNSRFDFTTLDFFPIKPKVLSSAWLQSLLFVIETNMYHSFKKILNRKDSKIEPWATPVMISVQLIKDSFRVVLWNLLHM